ncbi:MAG: LON peptidase substrate-binding domain-containing protein, partial [Actinomycetota bacterium]
MAPEGDPPDGRIGLFPLDLVLVPGERLPLHIFEDRFKDLIGRCIEEDSEFGVVLAEGEGMRSIGTTARITEVVMRYPDGRMDIVTTGARRFVVLDVTPSDSFLVGNVQMIEDEDPDGVLEEQIDKCVAAYLSLAETVGAE